MAQSINLIPRTEVTEQTKTKVVKLSTVLAIMILLFISGASFYFFNAVREIKAANVVVEADIENLRGDITELATIEITTRNLDKKHVSLKALFEERIYYSDMISELALRSPEGIELNSFTMRNDDEINISGKADNYITISDFTGNLLEHSVEGSALRGPFSTVTLNAVSLDSQDNTVSFAITIGYNAEAFKK